VFRVTPDGSVEPWVHVKPSTLSNGGMGAFAARNFKVGSTLGWYTGRICTEYDPLLNGEYAMGAGHNKVVDAAAGGSWTRFVNDGKRRRRKDKCNVEVGNEMDLTATHYIRKNQELFIDYGSEYWEGRRD